MSYQIVLDGNDSLESAIRIAETMADSFGAVNIVDSSYSLLASVYIEEVEDEPSEIDGIKYYESHFETRVEIL